MRPEERNKDVTTDDIYRMLAGEILPSDIEARRAAKARLKELGRVQNEIEIELEKLSTRKLLTMRRWCYDDYRYWGTNLFRPQSGDQFDPFDYALKAVLARRPHVPRGKERTEQRRKAATAHHGPKKPGGTAHDRKYKQPPKVSARRQWQARRKRFKEAKAYEAKHGWWPTWICPKPKSA